jgi:hypothetical protein
MYTESIKSCNCEGPNKNSQAAKFQNKIYGKGKRVFTLTKEGKPRHCTICGKVYVSAPSKKK